MAEAGVTHCAAMNFVAETPDQMIEAMQQFAEEVVPHFVGREMGDGGWELGRTDGQ